MKETKMKVIEDDENERDEDDREEAGKEGSGEDEIVNL